MRVYGSVKMKRGCRANQRMWNNADVSQRKKKPLWLVFMRIYQQIKTAELLPPSISICPFFLHVDRELVRFTLRCPCCLSASHHPSPPLWIGCKSGRWLRELVRLSRLGFHLVIMPLGIQTTLLPPKAVSLNNDSMKETSCHFNSHTHLLASVLWFLCPFSTPSAFISTISCPFSFMLPVFLPPPPCPSLLYVFHCGLFDNLHITNCVRTDVVSGYAWWNDCRCCLLRGTDLAEVTRPCSQQHPATPRACHTVWLHVRVICTHVWKYVGVSFWICCPVGFILPEDVCGQRVSKACYATLCSRGRRWIWHGLRTPPN